MAKLNNIKYKNFTFPNNPETTGFKCDRSYIKHKYPDLSGNELEDFGVNAIVVTGNGCFFGENAYTHFHNLYNEYSKNGVGDFRHPVFTEITRGLMTSLDFTIDPEVNVIKYSFEVVADTKPNTKENVSKYAVRDITSSASSSKSYNVGDIVYYKGGTHYISSYKSSRGYSARAGRAKITLGPSCKGNGGAHPYHLIHVDNTSNVYGWVDIGTFE